MKYFHKIFWRIKDEIFILYMHSASGGLPQYLYLHYSFSSIFWYLYDPIGL